jgi:hypothetical protein
VDDFTCKFNRINGPSMAARPRGRAVEIVPGFD